jgi:hypothetical protein
MTDSGCLGAGEMVRGKGIAICELVIFHFVICHFAIFRNGNLPLLG